MLEQWEKEKAEREQEHKKELSEMRQKVATLLAQQEEERSRFENAKQEVMIVKGERTGVIFCKAGAVGDGRIWGCVEHALRVFCTELGEVKAERGCLWHQE